ncbi:MAG: hypothetical protein AAFR16_14505, partial [Pseudomonadota bacterium]
AEPKQITLRRTGAAPLTFVGGELAHAMSYTSGGAPFWYEVNVFRMQGAGFVGDVRMFAKRDGETDRFTVMVAESFDEVISFLENYDAAADVAIDLDLDDQELSLAELTAKALGVRIKAEQARRQYRNLVGQMLFDLDQASAQGHA